MFLALHVLTLCLWLAACPHWPVPVPVTPERVGMGGVAPQAGPLVPHRSRPELVDVVLAAVPAPAAFPLGRPRAPDSFPGRRVSIRPQPTRAPQGEVMALSLSGGGGGGFRPRRWQGGPLQSGAVAGWQGT